MRSYLSKNEKRSFILAVCVLQILLLTGCGRICDLYVINDQVKREVVTGSPEADSTKESSADVQKEESVPPKIYWTLPVQDYEVFLQDGAEEETLDLWVNRKGEKQVVHTYQKNNADYQEPEDITGDTFEDVLGHDGFRISVLLSHQLFYEVDYYAMEEEPVHLANYWGVPDKDVYQVDADGDGIDEFICNVMYMDGAEETIIYHFDGEKVLTGFGRDLLKEEYDDYGLGSIGTEYLPEKNKILIRYWKDEREGFEEKEYDIDLEQIELYEFS